ncbi:DnaA/Hda family protein [Sphingomonas sp. KR1UV-12]|uniref:DnaA/Hda family protein n=1 Tax=Sphingomonas aurea TaxID=3063994 RepID=A0ABT9EHA7_9SPHN|nr:DnaA/Hda family protein [Sphingomonas sp. KR1UV-12]MDP1026158.1 DnaA/Hda family protein [Sphingomonas sp. KR1UV-12]
MSQLALPLAWPAEPRDAVFLVTPSNAAAVRMLEEWREWPVGTALLVGPPRSGRSTLGRLFVARTGGVVIDDAPAEPEESLFHAWNAAQDRQRPLLLIADAAPPAWPVALPDLRTRLAASPLATIAPPDDSLARALLAHHVERRGLPAPAELVDWLAARTERSHAAIERIVDALDRVSLERRRRLTIPLARSLLIEAGLIDAGATPGFLEDA